MPTTEHTINDTLAEVLRTTRHVWATEGVISSENTGVLKHASKRPDILVTEANVSPVVIETEIMPAATVENDAVSRLGDQVKTTGRTILSTIALRLPKRLRKKSGAQLANELRRIDDLELTYYSGNSPVSYSRWPQAGWVPFTRSRWALFTLSKRCDRRFLYQVERERIHLWSATRNLDHLECQRSGYQDPSERAAQAITTYETLLNRFWGRRNNGASKVVRAFVKQLRQKLGDDAADPTWIFNERGVGYRMPRPGDS